MAPKLLNYLLYQAGWFCCVLFAAYDRPGRAALAGTTLLGVHLLLLPRRRAEIRLLLAVGLLGGVVDSLQSRAGLLTFRSGALAGDLAPAWIVVMWMQFATLFRFGLSFLLGRYVLAASLAALGGPLAFWAGSRLGAVRLAQPEILTLAVVGAVWAVALPALLALARTQIDPGSIGRYRYLGSPS